MAKKINEWVSGPNRRFVLSPDDAEHLEQKTMEFVDKPRDEAENAAYEDYKKQNHIQAAAHHLAGMRAASASGDYNQAKRHKLVYDLHLKAMGAKNDGKIPTEVQNVMNDPVRETGYKFKPHKADAFLLGKNERGEYAILQKAWWDKSEGDTPTSYVPSAPPPVPKTVNYHSAADVKQAFGDYKLPKNFNPNNAAHWGKFLSGLKPQDRNFVAGTLFDHDRERAETGVGGWTKLSDIRARVKKKKVQKSLTDLWDAAPLQVKLEVSRELVKSMAPEILEELEKAEDYDWGQLRYDFLSPLSLAKNLDLPNYDKLEVRFGTNKLRQLRDWLVEHKMQEVNERDPRLPDPIRQALGRTGRDYNGNFSVARIQALIDKQPAMSYGYSMGPQWTGIQRHSDEPQNVLQINMTPEQMAKLQAAGVYGSFTNMADISRRSGHPVGPGTIGWIRWTGDPEKGLHIDEVQSDYGRKWSSLIEEQIAQAMASGQFSEAAANSLKQDLYSKLPDAHLKQIQKILFGNKHPAEVLHEAFHQYARQNGMVGTPVHIWSPEAKAHQNGLEHGRMLPGHYHMTYKDVPEKMGMVPGKYGELPTQTNTSIKRMRVGQVGDDIEWGKSKETFKDQIRKSEKRSYNAMVDDYNQRHMDEIDAEVKPGVSRNEAAKIVSDRRRAPGGEWHVPDAKKGEKSMTIDPNKIKVRDEGIRRQKLPPGAPGADKVGVGIFRDRKKEASRKAARRWKPED